MVNFVCRICNSSSLKKIINYKKVALSGNFVTKNRLKDEIKYPLNLYICKNCKHLQIKELLNPKLLFSHYVWKTSDSKTNISLIESLIKSIFKKKTINSETNLIEIASNDSSLLKIFNKKFKNLCVGIDPAKNLHNKFTNSKIVTICDFFSYNISKKIMKKYTKFDLLIARNVLAHVKKPNDIFRGFCNIISDSGIAIIEVPHLYTFYKENQYDNVFHEHIGFHSIKSFIDLAKQNKLFLFDCEIIDSQGGSIRCYFSKNNKLYNKSSNLRKIFNRETKIKLFNINSWYNFQKRVENHRNELLNLLKLLKKKKKIISIYGASGKGQVLMQFCNINNKLISFVYDKNKSKQNKFTPGSHILIKDPKFIKKDKPNYILILTWNLLNEVTKQEKKFIEGGGLFIVPFPKPKIIGSIK